MKRYTYFEVWQSIFARLIICLYVGVFGFACTKDKTDCVVKPDLRGNIGFQFGVAPIQPDRKLVHQDDAESSRLALNGAVDDEPLYLDITVEEGIESSSDRHHTDTDLVGAAPVTAASMQDAGIWAFNFNGDWDEFLRPDFMYNFRVSKNDNWKTERNFPGNSSKMRFYAYSPYNCKGLQLSPKEHLGSPAVIYTVPSSAYDQNDLLFGRSQDVVCSVAPELIALNFNHALSAIKFVTGKDLSKGTIKSMTISGVYTKGKCVLNDASTPQWSDLSLKGSFALSLDKASDGTSDKAITTDEQTLMMLPQVLPEGAKIEVLLVLNDGTEKRLAGDIGGQTWRAGTTVVYKVSSSGVKETFEFGVGDFAPFSSAGGTKNCTVTSYAYNTAKNKIPVGWTAQFSMDGGNTWSDTKPEWLGAFTTSHTGMEPRSNPDSFSFPVVVAKANGGVKVDHDKALRDKEPKTGVWNLSNRKGEAAIENTANCYIVNSAGTYSFPLVYGNAITNGQEVKSSYTSVYSDKMVLEVFPDYYDYPITSAYIYNNANSKPNKIRDAVLLWQDSPNLVTDIRLMPDKHTVQFSVNRDHIAQGNAVIAIKSITGYIIWSWHIWVTDLDLYDRTESCYGEDIPVARRAEATSAEDSQYYMMPVNLGWCCKSGSFHEPVKVLVKFTQNESGKTSILQIARNGAINGNVMGNNTYYQWGRKDPFPGALNDGSNKPWYSESGSRYTVNFHWSPDTWRVVKTILDPMTFYTNLEYLGCHPNMWNMQEDGVRLFYTETKTIFDPCPVGYMVPNRDAFSNFKRRVGKFNNGGTFASIDKSRTIFFPATGYRNGINRGILSDVGVMGDYHTLNPKNPERTSCVPSYSRLLSYGFLITQDMINNVDASLRAHASSVRPMREPNFKR